MGFDNCSGVFSIPGCSTTPGMSCSSSSGLHNEMGSSSQHPWQMLDSGSCSSSSSSSSRGGGLEGGGTYAHTLEGAHVQLLLQGKGEETLGEEEEKEETGEEGSWMSDFVSDLGFWLECIDMLDDQQQQLRVSRAVAAGVAEAAATAQHGTEAAMTATAAQEGSQAECPDGLSGLDLPSPSLLAPVEFDCASRVNVDPAPPTNSMAALKVDVRPATTTSAWL